jgi:hypothetical protein
MKALALLAACVVVSLLSGCGGRMVWTTPELDDAAALHATSSYHVMPVKYDFERPAEWEISDRDWPQKCAEWSAALGDTARNARNKSVYVVGPNTQPKDGAIVQFTVTQMRLGTYAFMFAEAGRIQGVMTVTDAASGKVIFKGSVDAPGTTEGNDRFSYEGRMKVAHWRVGDDIAWLIRREP